VTLAGTDAVQVFDTRTRQPVAQAATGASPHISVIAPDSRFSLVVAQGAGGLDILDTTTNTLSGEVKVGKAPHWGALGGDGRTAWVTNEGTNDVSVVDLATRAVTATIPVGNAPRKIAVQTAALAAADVVKDVRGLAKLEIEADDYYFKPAILVGRPGQKLALTVENESNTLHNLTIDAQHISLNVPPKKKVTVNVTFPTSGMIAFTCNLHAALGMRGRLDVTASR
jgi:YVTN family beta-propeller protein